jgi:hypothetical protein
MQKFEGSRGYSLKPEGTGSLFGPSHEGELATGHLYLARSINQ